MDFIQPPHFWQGLPVLQDEQERAPQSLHCALMGAGPF